MGSATVRPEALPGKLRRVREKFEYSLAEMAEKLSDDQISVPRENVFRFEKGEMEPSILILLRYSRLAKVKMEIFADDTKDLPF